MMATGFERYISCRAACSDTGGVEGMHFGMRFTGPLMPALAHHSAILHQHAADARVGICGVEPTAGERNGARHVAQVFRGRTVHFLPLPLSGINLSCLSRASAGGSF